MSILAAIVRLTTRRSGYMRPVTKKFIYNPDKGSSSRRTPTMKLIKIAAAAGAAMLVAAAANAQGVDFSKVEITTVDLGNKTYMLVGQGGNITVAVGTDGIIMVDSQYAPLYDKIKAAIAKISPLPIKYLINTHYHRDHVDGNELFNKAGATIVGHDNLRIRLAAGTSGRHPDHDLSGRRHEGRSRRPRRRSQARDQRPYRRRHLGL